MKVIDLLNKIARGEEVPKRIKYKDEIRVYVDDDKDYYCSGSRDYYLFFGVLHKGSGAEFKKALNDDVEIIGEYKIEENKIDKIEYSVDMDGDAYIYDNHRNNFLDGADVIIIDKINEIIDYLESKEKGE